MKYETPPMIIIMFTTQYESEVLDCWSDKTRHLKLEAGIFHYFLTFYWPIMNEGKKCLIVSI